MFGFDSPTHIEKGDTITVSDFSGAETIEVRWSEGFIPQDKAAKYLRLTFNIKTKARTGAAPKNIDQHEGFIFVEDRKLDDFKKKSVGGNSREFIVDDSYQYGQMNKDGTGRWLAYHNKDYKMFQHRFFERWNWTNNPGLVDTMKKFKLDAVLGGADYMKGILGDKLRNFY